MFGREIETLLKKLRAMNEAERKREILRKTDLAGQEGPPSFQDIFPR